MPRNNKPPTSVTARRHRPMQWPLKSKSCWTRSRNSPKQWPTKRTQQMAAEVAAVAAACMKEGKHEGMCSNTPNRTAWVATVLRMDFIQPARTTRVPPAHGNSLTMTLQQCGTTGKAAASTGHCPSASASSSRAMQPTQASQPQPTDRDRGRTIENEKRTIAKQ